MRCHRKAKGKDPVLEKKNKPLTAKQRNRQFCGQMVTRKNVTFRLMDTIHTFDGIRVTMQNFSSVEPPQVHNVPLAAILLGKKKIFRIETLTMEGQGNVLWGTFSKHGGHFFQERRGQRHVDKEMGGR